MKNKNKKKDYQYERIHGPDLDPENAVRAERNKKTLDNTIFIEACNKAGIKPTRRQAGKWNNKKGIARKTNILNKN